MTLSDPDTAKEATGDMQVRSGLAPGLIPTVGPKNGFFDFRVEEGVLAWVGCGLGTSNTMWRKLFYSGFETCFGPSTQGAGIRYQNTSQIQILRHFEKKRAAMYFWIDAPPACTVKRSCIRAPMRPSR